MFQAGRGTAAGATWIFWPDSKFGSGPTERSGTAQVALHQPRWTGDVVDGAATACVGTEQSEEAWRTIQIPVGLVSRRRRGHDTDRPRGT